MQNLLFRNANIATNHEVICGDILVKDGKISAIGPALEAAEARVIDAEGKYLLPGAVDAHTHFDLDMGFDRASDDFYTGSVAAACGGTTTVIDHMADGPDGCQLLHQVDVYHKLAKDCVVDYGLHGVLQHVNKEVLADMALLPGAGITSLKYYLTYDSKLNDDEVFSVMQRAKELGITLCVHCENHAIVTALRKKFSESGCTQPRYHPASRPPEAEAEAVFRSLALARAAGETKIYIVHLSTALGLHAAQLARQDGQKNIFLETCPQYLFLQDDRNEDDNTGLKFILSPPLRKEKDNAALWQGLAKNEVDTVATDHCPFFFSTQKQRGKGDFTLCPNGMPGVELRLPLLFSEGFLAGRLSLPQVVHSCCTRPAEIFGIAPQKGAISLGADADLVLFDPTIEWTIQQKELHEHVDYTPYEGMHLRGRPVMTMSRGDIVMENGQFLGQRGRGKYLHRHF